MARTGATERERATQAEEERTQAVAEATTLRRRNDDLVQELAREKDWRRSELGENKKKAQTATKAIIDAIDAKEKAVREANARADAEIERQRKRARAVEAEARTATAAAKAAADAAAETLARHASKQAELESAVDRLTRELAEAQEAKRHDVTELQIEVAALKRRSVEELDAVRADALAQKADLEDKLKAAKEQADEHLHTSDADLRTVRAQLEKLQAEHARATAEAARTLAETVEAADARRQKEVVELRAAAAAAAEKAGRKITALEKKVAELEAELEALREVSSQKIEALKEKVTEVRDEMDDAVEEAVENAELMNELEVKNLQAKIEELEGERDDQADRFEATVEKLLQDLEDARSGEGATGRAALMIQAAERARVDAEEQIANLQAKVDAEIASSARKLDAVKVELGGRVEQLTSERSALERELKKQKNAVTAAVEAKEDARRKMMRTQRSIDVMVSNATKLAVTKVEKEFTDHIRRLESTRAREAQDTLTARLRKDERIKSLEELLRPSQRKNTQLQAIVDKQRKLLAKRSKELRKQDEELAELRMRVLRRVNSAASTATAARAVGGGQENSPGWDKSFDGTVNLDNSGRGSSSEADPGGSPGAAWSKLDIKTIDIDEGDSPVTTPRSGAGAGGATTPRQPKYASEQGRKLLDALSLSLIHI